VPQTGLCDINIAAVDIAAPAVLPAHSRLPKRRFAEIGDSEDEDPDSDELYGWIEDDDEVAAEGLLIDNENAIADDPNTTATVQDRAEYQTDRVTEPDDKQVSPRRTATV
jgi:hypothetical protein